MNERIAEGYQKKLTNAEDAIGKISQGKRIFVGSFCSEPQHLVSTLLKNTDKYLLYCPKEYISNYLYSLAFTASLEMTAL